MMKIQKLSKKQAAIFKFTETDEMILICDGAVRSGKTVIMATAFIIWAMNHFDRTNFAFCGKTVQSVERNVMKPLQDVEALTDAYEMSYGVTTRILTVRAGTRVNWFYMFGGRDESSYMLIQGITLAGVMFDEVALMPRSFVEQAIARTISYAHPKLFFNCNPESPNHYFYQEWIKTEKPGTKHIHFLLEDNPILSPDMIARTKAMYEGVFYDRYILGLWVRAEGIIYRQFAENPKKYAISKETARNGLWGARMLTIGVDFGGNKSAHTFVATAIMRDWSIIVLRSQRLEASGVSVEQMIDAFRHFATVVERDYKSIDYVYADSAEQAIINSMDSQLPWRVCGSVKGEIIDRIRATDIMLNDGRLHYVGGDCNTWVTAMQDAVWDDKKIDAVRLDDGTSDIDTLDAFEYSWSAYIKQIVRN